MFSAQVQKLLDNQLIDEALTLLYKVYQDDDVEKYDDSRRFRDTISKQLVSVKDSVLKDEVRANIKRLIKDLKEEFEYLTEKTLHK